MYPSETRFLVVDDATAIVNLIVSCLKDLGYENVETAESGTKAFEILESLAEGDNPIDFIISDLNMPDMSGLELLQKCAVDPKLSTVPFLMLTSESQKDMVIQAVVLGVTDYLLKPFTSVSLKEKIDTIYLRFNG